MNPGKVFRFALAWLVVLLFTAPSGVYAAAQQDGKPFQQEQLDQLVAPIALYPDSLLAQILMASTYPLEVVEADRWVRKNGKLNGAALTSALDKVDWDPSVKALVPFPQVLSMMSDQLEWMQKLGDAFLAQQTDVMNTVQKLRAKAQAQSALKTTKEQKVVVEENIIRIEPVDPEVVYVPAYNPVVVYGPWPAPAYPPYYFGAPVVAAGIGFAAGVAVGATWGNWGHCNWGGGTININVNPPPPPPGPHPPGPGPHPPGPPPHGQQPGPNTVQPAHGQPGQHPGQTTNWQHDPAHRKGVAYRDNATRQRYSQNIPGNPDARKDYRGHSQGTTPPTGYKPAAPGTAARTGTAVPKGGAGSRSASGMTAPKGPTGLGAPTGFREPTGSRSSFQGGPGAFEGMGRGSEVKSESDRGRMSRESSMRGFGGGHGGFHGRR